MSQGLFAAISGIKACQSKIDVVADNISNMNTVAFKASKLNFANVFSSTLSSGSAPTGNVGGTNPIQIGLGVTVSEVGRNFTGGNVQPTGRTTDMNIQGNGFFTVTTPDGAIMLTRAGNFTTDSNGNLNTPQGLKVLGTSELSSNSGNTTPIRIPQQLNLAVAIGPDASGNPEIKQIDVNTPGNTVDTSTAPWNTAGWTVTQGTYDVSSFSVGKDGAIEVTYANGDKLTVTGDPRTLQYKTSTGLETSDPAVLGVSNNAVAAPELQLQLANVINPKGLISEGGNLFSFGPNAGTPTFACGNSGGMGSINTGGLESSNIDLTSEFADMMLAQRGIDASGRVFDVQNQVMRSIVNLGR